MATLNRNFIAEKLNSLVPTLDTSPGSKADKELIAPILDLFSGYSPEDFSEFLRTRLAEYNTSLFTDPGSAAGDILIASLTAIMEPLWWEIKTLKEYQSIGNYATIPDEDMDSLAANYFVVRKEGSYSKGSARVYFTKPYSILFTDFVSFETRAGLKFKPTQSFSISSDTISINRENGLYFVDVPLIATDAGTESNIVPNQITTINGLSVSYVRVVNQSAFTGGSERESNSDLYERIKDAITVRNLVSKKSIRYNLTTDIPAIKTIEVIGAGSPEMERDLVPYTIDRTTTITQILSGGSIPITVNIQTVTGSRSIHTGGKSDIYIYSGDLVEEHLDVGNLSTSPINLSAGSPYYIKMPLIRIKEIQRLDPLYLTNSGQIIPYRHPIDSRSFRDFYWGRDENALERAYGTVRLYFDDPTSFIINENTVFTADNGQKFIPVETQSIAASGMALNTGQKITEAGMYANIIYSQDIDYYYFDVSVRSLNVSDSNTLLNDGDYLSIVNYISEGWSLTSADTALSFSTKETMILTFTATFNDGITIDGEAVRIIYEYCPTVGEAQDYVDNDETRVVTTDQLVKHFQFAYVDLAVTYEGKVDPESMELYIRNFITAIAPGDYFEISDLIALMYQYGATRVITPINIFVLTLQKDRSYRSSRFSDRLSTSRRVYFTTRNISVKQLNSGVVFSS